MTALSDSKHKTAQVLSRQYGGSTAEGWVGRLPRPWIPYVQLARLDPPAALFLIYLPHLFGLLHAAKLLHLSFLEVFRVGGLLLGGSLFFSNAAHAWNDIVDAPIDRQVERTKGRPIARGAISTQAALAFTGTQALGAAAFLLTLPEPATAAATIPTMVGTAYYPWAKRHTHFPQLVLGLCLSWGIMVGSAAGGVDQPHRSPALWCLVGSATAWVMIYDTIYASQDLTDDVRIGVKSMTVLLRENTSAVLWGLLAVMAVLLSYYGHLTGAGLGYFVITVGGCMLSLGTMIAKVELKSQASCWWWFSVGFWYTGASIVLGMVWEGAIAPLFLSPESF
ncbi:UbiA prenyltransferase [Apiospora rasikravindrae]|uniref:UbiA prenyltransferase n=1 Tax=Apiospora rasikravindrae TaxID=990691 RepID=A0ABR1T0S8_9PEZI